MPQRYSSKCTSVNSKQLPAVYNKVDFVQLYQDIIADRPIEKYGPPLVYDYGCGKETKHIQQFLKRLGFEYCGYDKYWANNVYLPKIPNIVICSNLLNVIAEDDEIYDIHMMLKNINVPYFITVYEGNKSGIGCETKKDCYQRNKATEEYMTCSEAIRKKVITKPQYLKYIKKGGM